MKIIIDTNIWISIFINKEFQFFIEKILRNDIKIASSIQQIAEISAVLKHPKLSSYINKTFAEEFLLLFLKAVEIVEPKIKITDCRDVKDNFILEAAFSGNIDFIVTDDEDLLVLDPYKQIRIVKVRDFYNLAKLR